MGTTTNGQICYGVVTGEDYEFPWECEEFDHDIECWWKEMKGYQPTYNPFTDEGMFKDGWSMKDPRMKKYFSQRNDWLNENPLPAELVNAGSDEVPVYILAVPGSVVTARRGSPVAFCPTTYLNYGGRDNVEALEEFCDMIGVEWIDKIRWHLSSYWG